MKEETVFDDFSKTIQSASVRIGTNYDKVDRKLDRLNNQLDKILEILGITFEDNGSDYHVFKEEQESTKKEIEGAAGESGAQEILSSEVVVRSIDDVVQQKSPESDVPNQFLIPPLKTGSLMSQIVFSKLRVGWCAEGFKCITSDVLYGRSHEFYDALKLFDEVLELDAICWISVLIVPANNERHMDDPFTVVFDPRGMNLSWLHRLNELHKKDKNYCWCFIFPVSTILSIAYSLDYSKEHIPNDSNAFEWTQRHFNGLLDIYGRNVNSDVSDLQNNFLKCSSLGWRITICVGLTSGPNDTVHRSLVMVLGDAVEYMGSLVTFIMIIENEYTKLLLQGVRKDNVHVIVGEVVIISFVSLTIIEVSNFKDGKGLHEVIHADNRVAITCWPSARKANNRSTLHVEQLVMLKQLFEELHSIQLVFIHSCIMSDVIWWDTMLLLTTIWTWAMNYRLMYYEQGEVPLDLRFQMHEFFKIHNKRGKRSVQKMCWQVLFLVLEFVNLVVVTRHRHFETCNIDNILVSEMFIRRAGEMSPRQTEHGHLICTNSHIEIEPSWTDENIYMQRNLDTTTNIEQPTKVNVVFHHFQIMLLGNIAVTARIGHSWFSCQKFKVCYGYDGDFQMQYGSIGATLSNAQAEQERWKLDWELGLPVAYESRKCDLWCC